MNIIYLYYKRPQKIEKNAEWQRKFYTQLSYAIDGALRLALADYAVFVTCNEQKVIEWKESEITKIYKI